VREVLRDADGVAGDGVACVSDTRDSRPDQGVWDAAGEVLRLMHSFICMLLERY
jgi:hypothetical protein